MSQTASPLKAEVLRALSERSKDESRTRQVISLVVKNSPKYKKIRIKMG